MELKSRNPWLVSLWAFGIFVLSQTVLYAHFWISTQVTGATMDEMGSGSFASPATILSQGLVGFILGIPLLFLLARFLWRRPKSWIGLRFERRALLDGAALGLTMALVVVAVLFLLGVARISGWPTRFTPQELLMVLAGQITWTLFKTLCEEVVFRGMVAREFALRWGWPLATLGSGVFFSVIHMVGLIPILTPVLVVGILVAGLVANALFVLLYVKGRSLALPFGCHFAWNFALAGLIGTSMSGAEQSFGLFRVELAGPLVLTGGEFGVEMSTVGIVIWLVVLGVGFRHRYRDQIATLASGA